MDDVLNLEVEQVDFSPLLCFLRLDGSVLYFYTTRSCVSSEASFVRDLRGHDLDVDFHLVGPHTPYETWGRRGSEDLQPRHKVFLGLPTKQVCLCVRGTPEETLSFFLRRTSHFHVLGMWK